MTILAAHDDPPPLVRGAARSDLHIGGEAVTVFSYRPRDREDAGLLYLFDGLHRRAANIRDKAIDLAERTGLTAIAPRMDRERFPKWRYDRAGVIHEGKWQPPGQWTAPWLQRLVDWGKDATSQHAAKVYLLGHSAGGQFLSRLCAYTPLPDVERIVITNPSVYVVPQLDEPVPFGFDGLPPAEEPSTCLQRYLALPITIFLGQEDRGERNLVRSMRAMRQGPNRFERGRRIYRIGRAVATLNAWSFNWRLVEVPLVGHSSRDMLASARCGDALGLTDETTLRR